MCDGTRPPPPHPRRVPMDHTFPPPARTRRRGLRIAVVAATVLGLGLAATLAPGATAAPTKKTPAVVKTDVREIAPNKQFSTKKLTMKSSARAKSRVQAQADAGATPAVGTTRTLLALDDYNGILYRKSYTLQAVGSKIEVWVADDTTFPAGDCRAQVPNSTAVTRAQ